MFSKVIIVPPGMLEPDYCRIEMINATTSMKSPGLLEPDYCRIEIDN